ncbi:MAG TPA: hypothetical protein VKV32_06480 [Stellaceae bacterium]|nr:hypothetical protein [Stellaceae bacterium]
MESIFFVIALIGVLGVMNWAAVNDKAGNRGPTKGFFAMRDFVAEAQEAAATPPQEKLRRRSKRLR